MKRWVLFVVGLGLSLGSLAAQDLFSAVRGGDPDEIRLAIKAGAPINGLEIMGTDEKTPLMVAADQDDPAAFKVLVEAGAAVNFKTPYLGRNFLMYLSQCTGERNLELLNVAIKSGAKVDEIDLAGRTALMYAAEVGSETLVGALIKHRAGINIQSKTGETALYLSVSSSNQACAEHLLKAGANASLMSTQGRITTGPLHLAVDQGDQEMVSLLLKYKADVNLRTKGQWGGQTPLIKAVDNQDVEMTALLLKQGASAKIRDDNGYSPMDYAIQGGGEELNQIQALLTR